MWTFFLLVYCLLPGDAIVIRSTNYKELNDTIIVLHDTTAEFPYIGRISVKDLNQENLREFFSNTYSKYLTNPDIGSYILYRISVIGRVNKPGIYYVPSYSTLADILAIGGGPLPDGRLSGIKVYSNGKSLKINLVSSLKKELSCEDLGISSGAVIEVPRKIQINLEDIYKFAATTGILWSIYKDLIK